MGIFKSIGKFFKKNWKTIVGVVAAIAIPFAAPAIAGAIGASGFLASSIIGAGLGAGVAGITGQNPLLGAALGGLGGFGGQALGLAGSAGGGLFGSLGGVGAAAGAPTAAAVAPSAGLSAGTGLATAGGATGLGSSLASLGAKLASNIDMGGLAQLGMAMFGKDFSQLSEEEKRRVQETAQLAATNRGMFNQYVEAARKQQAASVPNPEQAWASTVGPGVTAANQQLRGATPAEQRVGMRQNQIAVTGRAGSAVVAENQRALNAGANAAGLLNVTAPEGPEGMNAALYDKKQAEKAARQKDIAFGLGGLWGSKSQTGTGGLTLGDMYTSLA